MAKTLFDALREFRKKDRISFHMPGHKNGEGLSWALKKYGMSIDVTEFDETDNLQEPTSILKAAQCRAAAVFDAGESFYLTNGSSIGLHAAILGSTRPGDTILVDRTCHRAVVAALVMGGVKPYFISPAFDEELGLYRGFTGRMIKLALDKCPEAVGAVITSPTYYGVCSDVRGIAACLHNSGKFLIVDEAHGAHFTFLPQFPQIALVQGADICVQSVHKTLPALGQTALLHVGKTSRVPAGEIKRALLLLQTTSPSYLLMTTMDEAILQMEKDGVKKLNSRMIALDRLKDRLRRKTALQFVDEKRIHRPQDPLRLVVDFQKTGISGAEAARMMKESFGIYPEMADARYVVFIVTAANTREEIKKLEEMLYYMGTTIFEASGDVPMQPLLLPEMVCLPAAAWQAERKKLPLDLAVGKVCAEIVGMCPPGAAVLVPGQKIDQANIDYLKKYQVIEKIEVLAE